MKKIVVRICGGLGNQIFQYLFGRSLSLKYKAKLFLDISPMVANRGEKYRRIYKDTYYKLSEFYIAGYDYSRLKSNFVNILGKKKIYNILPSICLNFFLVF